MGMYCELTAISAADAARLRAEEEPTAEPLRTLSLEKAWHGLHYLLTGCVDETDSVKGFLLAGGEYVGEDGGYGPDRLYDGVELAAISQALATLDEDSLWRSFNADKMTELGIYPGIWDEPEAELREEYLFYFNELRKFVQAATAAGDAIIVSIS